MKRFHFYSGEYVFRTPCDCDFGAAVVSPSAGRVLKIVAQRTNHVFTEIKVNPFYVFGRFSFHSK